MEHMNLLDITIRYFNVIVFVLCVLFGMISLFASWIAWREIHRKQKHHPERPRCIQHRGRYSRTEPHASRGF